MATREQLIQFIQTANETELAELAASLEKVREKAARVQRLSSHFGSWADLPDETFAMLTTGLHDDRKSRRD